MNNFGDLGERRSWESPRISSAKEKALENLLPGKRKLREYPISALHLISYEVCKTGRGREHLLSDV